MATVDEVEHGIQTAPPKAGNRVESKASARKGKAQARSIDDDFVKAEANKLLDSMADCADSVEIITPSGSSGPIDLKARKGTQKNLEGENVPVTVQAEHKTSFIYESKRLKLRISDEDRDWAVAAPLAEVKQMVREKARIKKDTAINGFEWERECDQIVAGIKGAAI